jgi:hypothetical protein
MEQIVHDAAGKTSEASWVDPGHGCQESVELTAHLRQVEGQPATWNSDFATTDTNAMNNQHSIPTNANDFFV